MPKLVIKPSDEAPQALVTENWTVRREDVGGSSWARSRPTLIIGLFLVAVFFLPIFATTDSQKHREDVLRNINNERLMQYQAKQDFKLSAVENRVQTKRVLATSKPQFEGLTTLRGNKHAAAETGMLEEFWEFAKEYTLAGYIFGEFSDAVDDGTVSNSLKELADIKPQIGNTDRKKPQRNR